MTNAVTNETAPWRSPSGKYAVRWVHLSVGWRFWAFNRDTDEEVGEFTSKLAAIRACERAEKKEAKKASTSAKAALVVGLFVGLSACRGTVPPPAAETVGQLAAGPSTWSAPVHATTDLTPSFGAVEGDDSATETVTTVTRADGGDDANPSESPSGSPELPEVAPKTDGVVLGGAR